MKYEIPHMDTKKPLLRGWSHFLAAIIAFFLFLILIAKTESHLNIFFPVLIYGIISIILYSFSALYHLGKWSKKIGIVLERIDHINIFLMIAGTYTVIVGSVMSGVWLFVLLGFVWSLSILAVAVDSFIFQLPRRILSLVYVIIGSIAVIALPEFWHIFGPFWFFVILIAGSFYLLGALFYAFRIPKLWPKIFGYHEAFHLCTIISAAFFYILIFYRIIPHGK